jgi:hypothetical protein
MSEQQLQKKRRPNEAPAEGGTTAEASPDRTKFSGQGAIPPVGTGWAPKKATDTDAAYGAEAQTHQVAQQGVNGSGGRLPYLDQIQQSFGQHDVSGVSAHTDGSAKAATGALGAQAYAMGNNVAFGGQPDLHTAAHEAAHVVQQRAGVQLKGGVGAEGDKYENNANAVADRVVQGKSATDLLDPVSHGGGQGVQSKAVQSKAVQFLGHKLGEKLPEGEAKPEFGEDFDQRRYSVEQYEGMWEKEQGKKLTDANKDTISRGCIGITANNIAGGGNPLQYAEATFADFDKAHLFMEGKNKELHEMRADPRQAGKAPEGEYILFAKQFWSNQKDADNKNPDDKAFRPDPKTGRVDMSGYKYRAQPGFVNFDYGFWDEASTSFWHANHSQPGMRVFQSTKEHFIRGYTDFDRCIFGVALAKNYDPGKAAMDANVGAAPAGGAAHEEEGR